MQAVDMVSGSPGKELPAGFHERLNRRLNRETFEEPAEKPVVMRSQLYRGIATVCILIVIMIMVREFDKDPYRFRQVTPRPDAE